MIARQQSDSLLQPYTVVAIRCIGDPRVPKMWDIVWQVVVELERAVGAATGPAPPSLV